MNDTFGLPSENSLAKLSQAPLPDWVKPMLASLNDRLFSDQDWIFERKLDGERCDLQGG